MKLKLGNLYFTWEFVRNNIFPMSKKCELEIKIAIKLTT